MLRRLFSPHLIIMLLADAACIALASLAAYLTRFEGQIPPPQWENFFTILPFLCVLRLGSFAYFKLYRGMWRYTGLTELLNVIKAVALSSLLIVAFLLVDSRFEGFSRSVFIMDAIYAVILIMGLRLVVGYSLTGNWFGLRAKWRAEARGNKRSCVVLGAGDAGVELVRAIASTPSSRIAIVGFFDDDPAKQGKFIHGIPVLGKIEDLPVWRESALGAETQEALIALPSVHGQAMRNVVAACAQAELPHRAIPRLDDIADGRVSIKKFRDLDYRDLLGRKPVDLDISSVAACIKDRVILVTGAGGSIGSELCRQIVKFRPARLVLLDACEANLYALQMEMEHRLGLDLHQPLLGTLQDREWLQAVLQSVKPDVVFHAAAYKHVPMLETQPWQAVANNISATAHLIDLAIENKVERLVVVSTDKAVRPTSVMGASKRMTELIMRARSGGGTKLMAVRFGNVAGSAGSVLPLFRRQLDNGGPLTVTHPEVVRYFMTVEEAALLILQAGTMGEDGEIFVLNMGEPVRIADMARDLIRLSGLKPDVDIEIKYVGLRPGEKLYEELIIDEEGILPTRHEKIMVLHGPRPDEMIISRIVSSLEAAARQRDRRAIVGILKEAIPEYTPWGGNGPAEGE